MPARTSRNKTGIQVPIHLVRKYFKKTLGLSYKKGKSWPVKYDPKKQRYIKSMFWIQLLAAMKTSECLINVDESSFSRLMKNEYSWIRKGEDETINNIWFSNSMSMISAITSEGSTISWWVNSTINSNIFSKFIRALKQFVITKVRIPIDKVLLILDNASIHKSKSMKMQYLEEGFRVIFLPAYMPELAPIEKYFSIIKSSMLKEASGILLNWRSDDAMEKLNRVFIKTTREEIIRLWLTLTKEINNWLDDIVDMI